MKLNTLSLSIMTMGALAGASLTAHASGYHFGTQSVSAQATANASAAEATDATTLFYNPAGMTRLQGTNFSGALNLVAPSVKYNNASASYPTQPYAAQPLPNGVTVPAGLNRSSAVSGSSSGKLTDDLLAVPHMYLTHQLNDRVTVGVGVYVPFASSTEYQRDSVLRYNVNQTSLTTIDINPTVAFKLNDQHSLAIGLIAQHADASLRQYANFGGSANPALNSLIPGVGGGHGNSDGYADVEGKDWGFGFNLGWMWEIDPTARVGVSYRSVIKHSLKGTADWTTPATLAGQAAASRGYIDSDARVDIKTPESLSVHGFKQLDSKWAVMGDVDQLQPTQVRAVQRQQLCRPDHEQNHPGAGLERQLESRHRRHVSVQRAAATALWRGLRPIAGAGRRTPSVHHAGQRSHLAVVWRQV